MTNEYQKNKLPENMTDEEKKELAIKLYNEVKDVILFKKDNESFEYYYKQLYLREESQQPGISESYYNENARVEFEHIDGKNIIFEICRWHPIQLSGRSGLNSTPCLMAEIYTLENGKKQLFWMLSFKSGTWSYDLEVSNLQNPYDILQGINLFSSFIHEQSIIKEYEKVSLEKAKKSGYKKISQEEIDTAVDDTLYYWIWGIFEKIKENYLSGITLTEDEYDKIYTNIESGIYLNFQESMPWNKTDDKKESKVVKFDKVSEYELTEEEILTVNEIFNFIIEFCFSSTPSIKANSEKVFLTEEDYNKIYQNIVADILNYRDKMSLNEKSQILTKKKKNDIRRNFFV